MNIKFKLLYTAATTRFCTYLIKGRAHLVGGLYHLESGGNFRTHMFMSCHTVSAFIPVLVTFPIKPTRAEAPQRHNLQSALAAVYLCLQAPVFWFLAHGSWLFWLLLLFLLLAPGSSVALPTLPVFPLLDLLSLSMSVCVCGRKEQSQQPEEVEHFKRI